MSVVVLSILSAPAVYAGATSNAYSSNGGAQGQNDKNTAKITVTFSDDCTDFHVESSKEISSVSVNYEDDFSYRKFEGSEIRHEDEDTDGDDPKGKNLQDFSREDDKPIKSTVVKWGSTRQVFNCPEDSGQTNPNPDEEPECSDGTDNDGDGKVDHPKDPGCEAPDDDDERNPGQGNGGGPPTDSPTPTESPTPGSPTPTDGCSGEGETIAVSAAGNDIVGTEGPNDDNAIDANVQSGSEAQSDCDTVDADAGTHSSNAPADDDSIDADVGSTAQAISDDDSIDVDVASQEHCQSDTTDIEVSVPPSADCTTPISSSNAAANVFAGVLDSVHKVFGTLFVG